MEDFPITPEKSPDLMRPLGLFWHCLPMPSTMKAVTGEERI